MVNRKKNVVFLLIVTLLAVTLTGCGLIGAQEDEVEQQLQDTGINNLELDFQPDLLQEKLENAEIDENGVFSITFTEAEVNDMMTIRREQVPEDEAEDLQNLFIRFEEGEVLLDGDLGTLFEDVLVARFTPSVENGAFQLDLAEANIGAIDIPTQFLNGLESAMNTGMDVLINNLPSPPNRLQSVEVEDGSLTIVAQRIEAAD